MREITLTQGKVALVDDDDFEFLNHFKWYYDTYAVRKIRLANGEQGKVFMHRLIMNTPEDMFTDHKDHNKLNNQKYNLRVCTQSQNLRNSKKQRNGLLPIKGVGVKVKNNNKNKYYYARIYVNGKRIEKLFPFTHEGQTQAAAFYNETAIKHFGEFAFLNPI